jgi:DNA-binding protein HU-beta
MAGIGDIAKKAGVKYEDASATIEGIRQLLLEGEKITLQDFGTFEIDVQDARDARNPQTGASVPVEAKSVPKFNFNYTFKQKVKEKVKVNDEKLAKKRERKEKINAKAAEKAAGTKTKAKK